MKLIKQNDFYLMTIHYFYKDSDNINILILFPMFRNIKILKFNKNILSL